MRKICNAITFICFYVSLSFMAQASLNLPVKVLGGDSYYFYKVKGKESVADISKKLGVSTDDIVLYNPSAAQGVTKNQLLFFPVQDFSDNKTGKSSVEVKDQKVLHQVKKGQSLYGISKIYNVTVDELVAANPYSYNNLKDGETIEIPVSGKSDRDIASLPAGSSILYHTIQKGETMYSVAKQYNTTIEQLLKLNPGIYPNNFIEGDVVKIVTNTPADITVKKNVKQVVTYSAKDNDSFESIAATHNVSVAELRNANPDLKKVKKGKTVYIPTDAVATKTVNSADATAKQLEQTYSSKIDKIFNDSHKTKNDSQINVAIILPFQLQKENPPRQAYLYTDFYKGTVLAADSIGKNCSKKININVYDTQNNLNVTDSILALPIMKNMDVIIAPSEPKQLERCNKFGRDNNVFVINCFSSKNEDYASNPQIIQLNMPTSFLAAAVNGLISSQFKDYEIVFLKDPSAEAADVVPEVEQYVKSRKIKSHTIDIINHVDFETLSSYMDPGSNYLFVPTTSSKHFFNKYSSALLDVKEKRFDCEVRLLGHPEYLALKESKALFQKIDTYVYSRFFVANEKRARDIRLKFKTSFGEDMINTTPSLGILGFDLAEYIISTLQNQGSFATPGNYYDGVQMDVELQRSSNWGGYINKCVELVHFSGNKVSESIIK